jgi:DNA end-binding protein Ku
MALIKRKQKGEDVHVAAEPEEEEAPPDLMEALRASVEAAKKSRRAPRRSSSWKPGRRASPTSRRRTARSRSR